MKPIGTSDGVEELACELLAECQEDTVIALGIILVKRAGEIEHWEWGSKFGFGPQLLYGAQHLAAQLLAEEE